MLDSPANIDVKWARVCNFSISREEMRRLDESYAIAHRLFEHDEEAFRETLDWVWDAMLQRHQPKP